MGSTKFTLHLSCTHILVASFNEIFNYFLYLDVPYHSHHPFSYHSMQKIPTIGRLEFLVSFSAKNNQLQTLPTDFAALTCVSANSTV